MKRTKLLAIPALAALLFTGCASAEAEPSNKAPTVVGVKDIECMVNSSVDFLDGVAALDNEDGDITPALDITVSPEVEVNDGYAYFGEVGSYTVSYTVKDSGGRVATKRAYVDVLDRETYRTFDMPEGYSAERSGSAKITKCGLETGVFKLDFEDGEIAEDVKLSRSYTLACGLEYTFRCNINSNAAGKVKVLADGGDCAETKVEEGANVLQFTYTPKPLEEETERDVKIDICLGALGEAQLTIGSVELEYPQEAGKETERTPDFNFDGKLDVRVDVKVNDEEGTDSGLRGNAWTVDGGKAAKLEITEVGINNRVWLGGVFINTGVELKSGVQYKISLKTECRPLDGRDPEAENDYEIVFKHKQWGPDEDISEATIRKPADGVQTAELNITDGTAGSLWIYVQSGTQENEITISDLSVIEVLGDRGKDIYEIEDFSATKGGVIENSQGNFTLNCTGGDMEVMSPSFPISGSSANYALSFRARVTGAESATMVVAMPLAGAWNPNPLWQQVKVTGEWAVYTFMCNGDDSDALHKIAWQINGFAEGAKLEVTDIKVSLKNSQLDS